LFAELPLAVLAFLGARRLLRATVAAGILAGARAQAAQAAAADHPATASAAVPQSPDAPNWARVGNWGRSCAGQSLRRASLSGSGLGEALPRSRAERQAERRADRGSQPGRTGQAA
jgi:hypothetical protein